ncbi:MAG: type I-C CRISPR-associated protein Cas8c/Csd1 [Candidatus Sumerlaeaceae bacterium]|nr:type I-C CRISPR-associated protein Cas8c/Csd1 [Candidatus Sumerlaeaceae bacterium]
MILKRLLELSDKLDDLPISGYQHRLITKAIHLNRKGEFQNVVPLTGEKRGTREGKIQLVPQEAPARTSGIKARLIADNANYVLGKTRAKDTSEKTMKRHEAYCSLVSDCAKATQEPSVEAVKRWIESGGPEALRDDPRITEDDEIIFVVDGEIPTELRSVQEYWASMGEECPDAFCLVTGKWGPVVERMPAPIKGVPGGQPTGTTLVSVNMACGESYGLTASLNSPISKVAAEKIGNTLNWLLQSERHSLRIGKMVYIYWTRGQDDFDFLTFLTAPRPEDVRALLVSAQHGREAAPVSGSDFFALCLSANVSRIVVRDYHETTIEAVKRSLKQWFERIMIVSPDGGGGEPMGVFRLAASLYREPKDMPPHVPVDLLRSAMAGSPLPEYLLGLAVKRNLAMQGPYEEIGNRRVLSTPRLAMIKAIIQEKEGIALDSLKTDHPDPAYHCGRLLAVLERIQRAALGDINATVVDRYYGAACSSPGSILGNLVNDAQPHLAKLRKNNKDKFHQMALEEVLSAIGAEFPRTLDLRRQGLFALGFYHQKAHDRAQAAAARASNISEGEAQ